ncbi:hypothetical protein CHS0354_000047 [Potamilus streckersoni]|uniref:Uncharacterized protein n=1 Tax=Potamilus streckersoni TaxID=2493646 RepID=A0AAE0TI33_9BIVA|nr:hypothetical protein CHS0354_000047 [Potamilus streckersoni]
MDQYSSKNYNNNSPSKFSKGRFCFKADASASHRHISEWKFETAIYGGHTLHEFIRITKADRKQPESDVLGLQKPTENITSKFGDYKSRQRTAQVSCFLKI